MQETGNNHQDPHKILSIRLNSDGLSFYVLYLSGATREIHIPFSSAGSAGADSAVDAVRSILESRKEFSDDYATVQIFLDTKDSAYIPAEIIDANFNSATIPPESLLNEAGIFPIESEIAVVSPPVEKLCAIMAFDRDVTDCIKAKFGNKAAFFSPLQENIELKGSLKLKGEAFVVNLTEHNFYITSFDNDGQLTVSEVYPYRSDADVIYYLHAISGETPCRPAHIYIRGRRALELIKVIKRYFRGVVYV